VIIFVSETVFGVFASSVAVRVMLFAPSVAVVRWNVIEGALAETVTLSPESVMSPVIV